jgi:hypothetical protein
MHAKATSKQERREYLAHANAPHMSGKVDTTESHIAVKWSHSQVAVLKQIPLSDFHKSTQVSYQWPSLLHQIAA